MTSAALEFTSLSASLSAQFLTFGSKHSSGSGRSVYSSSAAQLAAIPMQYSAPQPGTPESAHLATPPKCKLYCKKQSNAFITTTPPSTPEKLVQCPCCNQGVLVMPHDDAWCETSDCTHCLRCFERCDSSEAIYQYGKAECSVRPFPASPRTPPYDDEHQTCPHATVVPPCPPFKQTQPACPLCLQDHQPFSCWTGICESALTKQRHHTPASLRQSHSR